MPKNKIINIIIIFIVIFGLLIFIVGTCAHYYPTAKPFWQITLFQVMQLVISILIAYFIAHYLKNKYSEKQTLRNIYLSISDDISKTIEKESIALLTFMRANEKTEDDRAKILIMLSRIGNKITILEENKNKVRIEIAEIITSIREDYYFLREVITGSDEFIHSNAFSGDNINKVLKGTNNILLKIDQIKFKIYM